MPFARDVYVVHYHEVGLKGRNRSYFENRLAENIRTRVQALGIQKVQPVAGRLLVELGGEFDMPGIEKALSRTFGISGFALAVRVPASREAIIEAALELAAGRPFESFQVRARRGHTSFPDDSQTMNEVVGQAIKDSTGARVDLSNAECTFHVEVVHNFALLYTERSEGPGGLPVGASGRVLALLSGGIDSPVAAWQMAKRGADVDFIHFHGQPFSDPSSVRQATRLGRHLTEWLGRSRLWLIPFGDIQSEIVTAAPQELRIVAYRRFMMRIAGALALREGIGGLVTGESLGQVASQTLPNLTTIGSVVTSMPILRPLIGRDKIEIEADAKKIGTYEISIQPHQDCCVLFVPRKVTTHSSAAEMERAEAALDVEALVEKGLANATVEELPGP
jgi:thiamine biosynthesis protein ThiI